eukprot:1159670-Pelagomonas_calceolata.AAC.9
MFDLQKHTAAAIPWHRVLYRVLHGLCGGLIHALRPNQPACLVDPVLMLLVGMKAEGSRAQGRDIPDHTYLLLS